jgi:hypothetical protein
MMLTLKRVLFVARGWPKGRKIGYGLRDHWQMSRDAYVDPDDRTR